MAYIIILIISFRRTRVIENYCFTPFDAIIASVLDLNTKLQILPEYESQAMTENQQHDLRSCSKFSKLARIRTSWVNSTFQPKPEKPFPFNTNSIISGYLQNLPLTHFPGFKLPDDASEKYRQLSTKWAPQTGIDIVS